jgi:hypothetical protein
MTLLKNGRQKKSINLSIGDGWNFGIGFGLAMIIAMPVILLILSCIIGIGFSMVGTSLGALWP